jgi:small-conductance mechanosensitive channel
MTVLVGAFGVGIGFGMQSVVNNFVSGLILLFERPIHVGDVVELEALQGCGAPDWHPGPASYTPCRS